MSRFSYIGWIPCVSGRLSIEHLSGDFTYKCKNLKLFKKFRKFIPSITAPSYKGARQVTPEERYAFCFFRQDTKDYGGSSKNGEHDILLLIEQSDDLGSEYSGEIIWWERTEKNSAPPEIQNICRDLHNLNSDLTDSSWVNLFKEMKALILNKNQLTFSRTTFKLHGDGICYFNETTSSNNGKEISLKNHEESLLSTQSYYALRQCLHKHKHHAETDDAIIRCHSIQELEKKYGANTGMALINDIKASMISIHRSPTTDHSQLLRSVGFKDYAHSLIETLKKHNLINHDKINAEKSYFSNIANSIELVSKARLIEKRDSEYRLSSIRIKLVTVTAVLMPFLIFLKDSIIEKTSTQLEDKSTVNPMFDPIVDFIISIISNPIIAPIIIIIITMWVFWSGLPTLKFPKSWAKNKLWRKFILRLILPKSLILPTSIAIIIFGLFLLSSSLIKSFI